MDPFEPKQEVTTSNLTPEQFNLQKVARWMTLYHLVMIPLMIFLGNQVISSIDWIGDKLFSMQAINTGSNDFWMVPVIGLFVTLTFCSWRVWRNPIKLDWMQPVILVHGIMAFSFLAYFFIDVRSLAYLGAMILEIGLFVVSGYFWWASKPSND